MAAVLDADDALSRCARIGPFFALDTGLPVSDWAPVAALAEPAELDRQVGRTRAVIAAGFDGDAHAVAPRVGASILFLGLAARLLSPALGCAAVADAVPEYTDLRYGSDSSPLPLGVPRPAIHGAPDAEALAGLIRSNVIDAILTPLANAMAERFTVSQLVLRGNIASAITGAAGQIAAARPDRSTSAAAVTDALLNAEPLVGTARLTPTGGRYRRTTCCLFYRVPGVGYCADCVLAGR